MASVPVPVTNVGRGYTVVTQVLPSSTVEQNSTHTLSPLSKFLKGEPKALGTVEIMIGLLTLLFAISLATYYDSITIFSGIVLLSSALHITAGSLAVSASHELNSCVVKATLTLNIFSTLSAVVTIVILMIDMILGHLTICHYDSTLHYTKCEEHVSEGMRRRILGVLLVFALLQFCISIALSAFTCKAICTSEPTVNIINMFENPESVAPGAPVNNPFPPHHTQQGVNMMHGVTMATAPGRNPPAYSEKMSDLLR